MTEEKPTPEALAFTEVLGWGSRGDRSKQALLLDACIENALKRREDALESTQAELRSACVAHCTERGALEVELESLRGVIGDERGAHGETSGALALANMELEATRKELRRAEARMDLHIHQRDTARAELESLRKPLERELAGDLELLRESISDWVEGEDSYDRSHAALDRIEAALRAKGEPQAAEPQEPRPIVVGSKWRHRIGYKDVIESAEDGYVRVVGIDRSYTEDDFREKYTHVSDPEPAAPAPEPFVPCARCRKPVEHERHCYVIPTCYACLPPPPPIKTIGLHPAPELPRKVEPGTTLTVGARYRITAISADDNCPCDQVGDVVTGYTDSQKMPVGTVFVNWDSDGYWFVKGSCSSGGTYVTGLELVADAPKESK